MSWIKKLKETYENCTCEIGKGIESDEKVLLPICHTTQVAHIRVVLNETANFVKAELINKDQQNVVTPCTESSGGRSGKKPINHALFDKLQYLAGDFKRFGGIYTIGYEEAYSHFVDKEDFFLSTENPHFLYMNQLKDWVESIHSTPKVELVYKYLLEGTLISDLVDHKVLFVDENGTLYNKKQNDIEKDVPGIFKLLSGGVDQNGKLKPWQANAFVVFSVNIPGDPSSDLDKDKDVWQSWANYYTSTKSIQGFCHVSGEKSFLSDQHPSKIRSTIDKAKLISANDTTGFTYRGRFENDEQACTIGYEVSQKAHNALRWLIAKQGYRDGDLAIVAWSPIGKVIPEPLEDSDTLFGESENEIPTENLVNTAEYTAKTLSHRIAGYTKELGPTDDVVVMSVNSATTGRLSIGFYRELTGADFLKRIESWHTGCAWLQKYSKKKVFYGAPAPKDIAWAAFGTKLGTSGRVVDDKIKRHTIERLLPCIIDGQQIPTDIVKTLVREASKRIIHDNWEWEKILGIACAVFRKSNQQKGYTMALEEERTSRDYLYGRLLAVADCLEGFALSQSEKGRPTNAARMMQRFADHPCSTWRTIELALSPYKARLGHKCTKYEKALDQIMSKFIADDFANDTALSGEFLLGYHSQRAELNKKPKTNSQTGDDK